MDDRFNRNELLFGSEGQTRIRDTAIGIVGVGGLGSHIAQQAAYLGVEHFTLIDGDVVTTSSLNRMMGATPDDVGRHKVDVVSDLVQAIQPGARVSAIQNWLAEDESKEALRGVGFVFGCVDDDWSRLQLLENWQILDVPYIDLASDINPDPAPPVFGGRVIVCLKGHGCTFCLQVLDQNEIRRLSMTPEQRADYDRMYGISRDALDQAGPSVVSVNGVVASLAVTEFMVSVTGIRPPLRHLTYRGDQGRVGANIDPPRDGCPYCGYRAPSSS